MEPNRPLPTPITPEAKPYWDGLKEHQFLLYRCKRCGASYWPMALCRNHHDIPSPAEMEWASRIWPPSVCRT